MFTDVGSLLIFQREEEEDMVAGEKRLGMEDSANNCAEGMHVLAVDDDHVSLRVLEAPLRCCNYRGEC